MKGCISANSDRISMNLDGWQGPFLHFLDVLISQNLKEAQSVRFWRAGSHLCISIMNQIYTTVTACEYVCNKPPTEIGSREIAF